MPIFHYTARDGKGLLVRELVAFNNEITLRDHLMAADVADDQVPAATGRAARLALRIRADTEPDVGRCLGDGNGAVAGAPG